MFRKKILPLIITAALSIILIPSQAFAEEAKLRIMPLGDSITDGYWLPGGYRTTLCSLLRENGLDSKVDLVGPNWGGDCYDPNHAGYSGYSIDNIDQSQSISGGRIGISSFVQDLLKSYPADAVMLQIGTNDILSLYDLDNIGRRLEGLVNMVLEGIGGGRLYLATIPCMDANDTLYINEYFFTPESMDNIVDSYNAQIKELASRLASEGKNVVLADINSVLDKNDLFDGVHPNEEGYRKMGVYWYSLLSDYISGGETPQPNEVKGDVNKDGVLDKLDISLVQDWLLGRASSLDRWESVDMNGDGIINVFDLCLMKRRLLKP